MGVEREREFIPFVLNSEDGPSLMQQLQSLHRSLYDMFICICLCVYVYGYIFTHTYMYMGVERERLSLLC